ncbi:MAG: hypothetical protein II569_00090 [Paludibacteraceae bacterium]|nr:hypothetical protein [Paludibacteraceae bacterium]
MKKTLLKLSIFALGLLTSVGVSAASTEIFSWTPTSSDITAATEGSVAVTGVTWDNSKLGAKLGSTSAFAVLTLSSGTFEVGDVITVTMQNTSHQIGIFLYDADATKYDYGKAPLKTSNGSGELTATFDGKDKIVIARGSGTTMYLQKLVIDRPVKTPALKAFQLNGIDGTIDENAGTVTIELPYGSTEPSDAEILAACTVNSAATDPTTYDAATHTITVTDGTTPKDYVLTITYAAAKTDATLKSLSYNGTAIELAEGTYSYDVELPYGTSAIPTVAYEINDETATAVPTQASALPGTATVVVTAQDGTTELTYTVNFTVKATASTDATLKSLKAGSITVSLADGQYDYDVELPAGTTEAPALSYELNDETASAVVTDATSATGAASIVVTAQDGTTEHTYNVQFSIAAAPKTLLALPFDNGVKGYIYNATPSDPNYTAHTIYVPYIGATTPTAGAATTKEGTTSAEVAANTVTLTSSVDGSSQEYALNFVQLTPVTIDDLTTPYTHTFDGSEIGSWIYSVYGYDASKGLKFAKTTNDTNNMRDAEGKTRIVFAIPAGVTHVELTSAGTKRNIKIPADGTTTNFDAADSYTFDLAGTEASLVMVESNQTGGDGGFSAITLSATSDPATGVEEAEAEVVKTYYISADGKTYNVAVKGLPLIKVEELSNGTIKTSKIMIED